MTSESAKRAKKESASALETLEHRLRDVEQLLRDHERRPHPPAPITRPRALRTTEYVVRTGDTLSLIAARLLGNAGRFKEIAALNNLRGAIFEGQTLKLPSP